MKHAVILFICFCTTANAAYPSTFPYENESYSPPNLIAAVPSFTYDENDPGGYFYQLIMTDLEDVMQNGYRSNTNTESGMYPPGTPWCAAGSSWLEWSMIANWGIPPTLPFQNWNCTAKDLSFKTSDFTGVVNGVQGPQIVCDIGSCCESYIGLVNWSDDAAGWHKWLDNLAEFGLCEDLTLEAMYCQLVDGHYRVNCYERLLSTTERTVTNVCPDTMMRYWLSCPVYKTVEMYHGFLLEPEAYVNQLSHEQKMVLEISYIHNDRVCHPYSYYEPDSTESGTSTSTSDSGSESKASVVALSLILPLFLVL